MDEKKILVCGGAGFIGSRLCDRLVSEGNRVICLDNLSTGSLNNIQELLDHGKNFRFVNHDINEPVQGYEVDEIYNLACPGSPEHYQKKPLSTFMSCTHGSFNLLDMARQRNSRILQASSCGVYGESGRYPQNERDNGNINPGSPRSCYNEGKRCAETMFMIFNGLYGLPVKIARIFNTYGPGSGLDDGRAIPNFIIRALCNKPLIIYGDGSQRRSFCYIDDMIDGLVAMMNSPDELTGPINFGNPEEFTIKKLAMLIVELTNSRSSIVYRPLPADIPDRRKPSIDLAIEEVKWWPRVPFKEGIMKTINYYNGLLCNSKYKAALNSKMNRDNAYAGAVNGLVERPASTIRLR